ncbi:MAG: hypothetical protein LBB85_00980, partial [Dysgonamonadaceae bacterium]|nr:hypothetical protein [Dysgonamonadaceae bacterium]
IGTFVYKFLFEEEVKEKRENARRISEVRKAEREAIEKYRNRRLMDIESHALKRMSEKKILSQK